MVSSMCLITSGQIVAAPSPIDDEDFLLFLADSLDDEGITVDPLTMSESLKDTTHSDKQTELQSSQHTHQQQEDKNER
jgi:hypothetical protein